MGEGTNWHVRFLFCILEVEWHDTASSGGDGVDEEEDVHCPPGRIPCRSHNYYNNNNNRRQQQQRQRHICLRQDQLCDMHPDCREAEDELEQLHKCCEWKTEGGKRGKKEFA